MEKRPPQQVKVELTEPAAEGTYSNWVMITYGSSEFIIDFGRFLPGLSKTKVYSRIIMTPQHIKHLLKVLQNNVSNFEKKFGEIKSMGDQEKTKDIGF